MDFSKHIQKAEEALRRRNFDYAVELFRQLVDLDPDLGEARAGLRVALRKRHESKKGGKFLRAVSGAIPLSRAKACLKLGKFDAGAKALEDYLATNPLDEEANLLLGQSLEQAEHFHSARAVYEFTAEIAPRNAAALKSAGLMMQRTGEPERALEYFERALAADPRDQEALKARKNLSAHLALERSSSDSVSHSRDLMKGGAEAAVQERAKRMHLSEEELEAELERLENAFAEDPSNPDLMLELSRVHEKRKDLEAALELAERALEYRRDSFELACRVGDLESKVQKRRIAKADREGRTEEASKLEAELVEREVTDWKRRVDLRPGEADLRLTLARKLMRAGRTDDALAELQRCRSEPRVAADALFLLGKCFEEKGILDLARKEYEHALEGRNGIDERAKEILYHLGTIAEREGNREEARARYLQIYEVDIKYRDVATKMGSL
ncbi:MAG TPA: tetratricopeptide repeat protein [Planctomycetes bacterium]|nr:tetratricopeptide repeat protein [Planctomycetota bacterium]